MKKRNKKKPGHSKKQSHVQNPKTATEISINKHLSRITPRIKQSGIYWVLLIIISLALILLVNLFFASSSVHWPRTDAKIVKSTVVKKSFSTVDGDKVVSIVDIKYDYYIHNKKHTSDYVSGQTEYPELLVKQYPKGKTVTISYNPKSPRQSILEPSLERKDLWKYFVMAILIFFIISVTALFLWANSKGQMT
jgi:hypothetical protein